MKNIFYVCWINDHYREEIVDIDADIPMVGDHIDLNGQKGKILGRHLITDGINSKWTLMIRDTKEMKTNKF